MKVKLADGVGRGNWKGYKSQKGKRQGAEIAKEKNSGSKLHIHNS